MILDTPSKLYTVRHIEVVASWLGFPAGRQSTPRTGDRPLYFDLRKRDHAVMAELPASAFSGGVTISLAR